MIAVALTSCFDFTSSENYTLIANFEYGSELTLRSDSTYYAEKGYAIGYNYLAFCHSVETSTYEFLGGFRVSGLEGVYDPEPKEEETESQPVVKALDMTWRAHSIKGANTYLVYKFGSTRPTNDVEFLLPTNGTCTMKMCQVTNTGKVAEEIAATFQRGDKLTLIATGYKGGQMTGSESLLWQIILRMINLDSQRIQLFQNGQTSTCLHSSQLIKSILHWCQLRVFRSISVLIT